MQELVQQVMERAGISEQSAIAAVAAVMDYIKQRAPAPVAAQLEQYLTDDTAKSVVGAAEGALGQMFGEHKSE